MPAGPVRRARRLSTFAVAAGAAIVVAATSTAAAGTAFAGTGTTGWGAPSAPARGQGVPRPEVIGPITGGEHGRPFTSSPVPVQPAGYVQQEFFIQGRATGYLPVGTWTSNGRWKVRPAETARYETRILVRRPADPAKFNGTVVVEWLNVSFQVDVDPDYLYESQQLLKDGYAWVGVSAQQLGVQGPLGL